VQARPGTYALLASEPLDELDPDEPESDDFFSDDLFSEEEPESDDEPDPEEPDPEEEVDSLDFSFDAAFEEDRLSVL
jgi:hypothetical protein